jgi:hypothetical protein
MRIYQSSITSGVLFDLFERNEETKINVLRSYRTDGPETLRLLQAAPANINSLILDSGVWALNQGTLKHKSTVKTYEKFLTRNKELFDFYFNFDEKFDGDTLEVNWANQIYLEKKGQCPVPVIHSFEKEELDHFKSLREKYERIAIGSTMTKNENELKDVVEQLKDIGFKVHVFAYGSYKKLIDLKAWSTDCSSFAQWVSSGRVIFFSKIREEEVTFSFLPENGSGEPNKDYIYSAKFVDRDSILEEYQDYMYQNLGFTENDLFTETSKRIAANAFYFSTLENIITEKQKSDGLEFDIW